MSQVTLSVDEYMALRRQIDDLEHEKLMLRNQIKEAKLVDPTDRVAWMNRTLRAAIEVVRFAVANLPPQDFVKWPAVSLRMLADGLVDLPDYNEADDGQLRITWRQFFDEILASRREIAAKQANLADVSGPA